MSDTTIGQDYYDLLGVSRSATTEEIKAAYRERLKETHPDVSDHANASARTKQLIEAKDVLTDETERARYDRLGHDTYVSGGAIPGGGPSESGGGSAERRTQDTTQSTRDQSRSGRRNTKSRAERTATDTSWYRESNSHWNSQGDEEVEDTWDAWNAERPYSVRGRVDGLHGSRLFPPGQSLILLSATFLLYPVLLAGTVAPFFPLLVNAVLGVCLLGVVVYLQTIPEVGIVVFGGWALFLPAVLWAGLGIGPLTAPFGIALVATVLPLGLSLLTRAAIRP